VLCCVVLCCVVLCCVVLCCVVLCCVVLCVCVCVCVLVYRSCTAGTDVHTYGETDYSFVKKRGLENT
jgi:preprotein translocase subunit SecG